MSRAQIDAALVEITRRERAFGPEAPETLDALEDLADASGDAGDLDAVAEISQQLVDARERVLGRTHPTTLRTRDDLAQSLIDVDRVDEAIAVLEVTVRRREKHLPDDPEVFETRFILAEAASRSGEGSAAIELHGQVLAERDARLGPDHTDTIRSRDALAAVLATSGEIERALGLLGQNVASLERALGPQHPETVAALQVLDAASERAGFAPRPVDIPVDAADALSRPRSEDPGTLDSYTEIALRYAQDGRYDEAADYIARTLRVRYRTLGPDHPDTIATQQQLAAVREAAEAAGRA